MKSFVTIIVGLSLSATASAQSISYNYDASGNRTERARTVVLHSSSHTESVEAADTLVSMTDSIGSIHFAVKASYQNESIVVDVEHSDNQAVLSYTLYNVSGQRLATVTGSASALFDMSAGPEGIYMIVVSDGKEQKTWKVIKK